MRVLIVGQCFEYAASGYASCHVCESRDLELAKQFVNLGYANVDIVATVPGHRTDMRVHLLTWDMVCGGDYEADLVVLSDISGWWNTKKAGHGPEDFVRSVNHRTYGVFDAAYENTHELDFLSGAVITSPQHAFSYQRAHPPQKVWYAPWGCPTVPDWLPDPWKGDRSVKRVVFTGVVHDRMLPMLNWLAEGRDPELWVAGLFRATPDTYWGGLSDEDRRRLCSPRMHFMSDLIGQRDRNGPVRFGDMFPFLMHADAGVNLTPAHPCASVSSKIYDYLACGTPVVTEEGATNAGHVLTLRAGETVLFDNEHALAVGVHRVCNTTYDRRAIREQAKMMASWETAARIIHSDAMVRA